MVASFSCLMVLMLFCGVVVGLDSPYMQALKSASSAYVQKGDILIGAIMSIHKYSEEAPCGRGLRESAVLQRTEAMAYAVKHINKDPYILKDTSLGFVILDDCLKPSTALAQGLRFMPLSSTSQQKEGFFPVIGVIGAESSDASIMLADLLGVFGIPLISPSATSDLLSDKVRFPYFLRLAPPDRLQVRAILQLIHHFNWTYVSAVYAEGGYGEAAMDRLTSLAPNHDVCIGASLPVKRGLTRESYISILEKLKKASARVVVLFIDQEEASALWAAAKDIGYVRDFIWIGSDGVGVNLDDFSGYEDVAKGALSLRAMSADVPEFNNYFKSMKKKAYHHNPWFKEENKTNVLNVHDAFLPDSFVANIIDVVYTYAHALDAYIKDHCYSSANQKTNLHACINTTVLLRYLHNVSYIGESGNISFDNNGDMLGRYEILNYQVDNGKHTAEKVGVWDAATEMLIINETHIKWDFKHLLPNQTLPEARCGWPCGVGQIYSYFRDTCCWECRHCNNNEITDINMTRCMTCPRFTWPDTETSTRCEVITPEYIRWHEPLILILVALSLAGISLCSVVFVIFIRNNGARIIKATSRELSYIMLGGVTIQYILVFTFVTKPERFICYFNYIGFNVSFTVVYAPLLTRTNRIYRIFNAGKRTKVLPSLTSPISQVVITLLLILTQIAINVIVSISSPPEVKTRMPSLVEKHVELVCTMPLQGFCTSLAYNILLVFICTIYAFKTRTLPDNFNESRYITLCVYTTLVIWLAFLPTYFTTSFAYSEIILITCALLFNGTVTMFCLYVPRIYALHREQKYGSQQNPLKYNIHSSNSANNLRVERREMTPITQNCLQEDQVTCTELSEYCNN